MKKKQAKTGGQEYKASIDLHGRTVGEARDLVDQFLMRINSIEGGRARIVVGKGTGTIKEFVTKYLRQAGYSFEFEKQPNGKPNEGVLTVFL